MADRPPVPRLSPNGISEFEKGTSTAPVVQGQPSAGSAPSWKLGDVAELKKPDRVDRIILLASDCVVSVGQGQQLKRELKALIKAQPGITVEVFENSAALSARETQLGSTSSDEGTGLHGFTNPVVRGGIARADEPEEILRRIHFIVGLTPPFKGQFPRSKVEFLEDSDPVRMLKSAVTIFHEFLHVWFMMSRGVDNFAAASVSGFSDLFPHFEDTGHLGDATFNINPETLTLITEGTVDPRFRARLAAFVDQVVTSFELRKKVEEVLKSVKAAEPVKP